MGAGPVSMRRAAVNARARTPTPLAARRGAPRSTPRFPASRSEFVGCPCYCFLRRVRVDAALGHDCGNKLRNGAQANGVVTVAVGTRHECTDVGAQPGQTFDIQVYAINGPVSDPPSNFIWVRSATLDFYKPDASRRRVAVSVDRKAPALDTIVPAEPSLEHLATGFQFTEGPVWVPAEQSLLFSDPNDNTIYRWNDDTGISVFRVKSGYAGADIGEYHQPGSNGLTLDADGRLTIAEHGNRRISRLEPKGQITLLADRYEGRRLNSPNDLVYRSDGALYFTDPPFGLPRVYDDPRKDLPYSGVFRLKDGKLTLVSTDLKGPNGLAFSPDERHLYVTNWDEKAKVVMRYEVTADGSLANGRVFFDMTSAAGEEALDGVKVDRMGNLFVSGPGGLWILSPEGVHLGTVKGPELAANLAWGDDDGKSLYLTARSGLYRLRVLTGAARAGSAVTRR